MITGYLCVHNHLFLIVGPHVWSYGDKYPGIWQKRPGHCGCPMAKHDNLHHKHADGSDGFAYGDAIRYTCACSGSNTGIKGRATLKRKLLFAASSAIALNGYAAAVQILKGSYPHAPLGITSYDHPLPLNFPAGR